MEQLSRPEDFEMDIRLAPIGKLSDKYRCFTVFVSANVLGTDNCFDGRRHEWSFASVKVLSSGAFFCWGGKTEKDCRVFENPRNKNNRTSMRKLAQKLAKFICPNHFGLVYHGELIHQLCEKVNKHLAIHIVMNQ
jgi:hypothetical protein